MDDSFSGLGPAKATSKPVRLRVALLGAGIFATNSHAPVLMKYKDVFEPIAVWSRRKENAQKLVDKLECGAEALGGDKELEVLLTRNDFDACILALPLDVQPSLIPRILRAGKHVLSEKPIAPTVQKAQQLLDEYATIYKTTPLVWSVAENFRYEPAITKTAKLVQSGTIGDIIMFTVVVKNPFPPGNPYLSTKWRKRPSWYGGEFVDAFIHAAAAIRTMIPGGIGQVSALTSHRADHLPGPDTMVGYLTCESGLQGTVSASYASGTFKYEFEFTGLAGTILLQRSLSQPGYNLIVVKGVGKDTEIKKEFIKFQGLNNEFLAFADACRSGDCTRDINTPHEALADLEVVEALLDSGRKGGATVKLRWQEFC